ncbi:MAG: SHOCT domain-containing protein [Chloroflexi bacterium]|nr:MAG: SHOCT domain-containing protein [Chloroflexota bacterium]
MTAGPRSRRAAWSRRPPRGADAAYCSLVRAAGDAGFLGWPDCAGDLGISRIRPADSGDSALNILNERFARGEIDQQEYEQRKAALQRQ